MLTCTPPETRCWVRTIRILFTATAHLAFPPNQATQMVALLLNPPLLSRLVLSLLLPLAFYLSIFAEFASLWPSALLLIPVSPIASPAIPTMIRSAVFTTTTRPRCGPWRCGVLVVGILCRLALGPCRVKRLRGGRWLAIPVLPGT